VIFYIKDITEIKAIKEKAELLLNLSPVGICEWRPGGELLDINDQYAGLVGYSKEEVFKMGWERLTPDEHKDAERLHVEDMLKKKAGVAYKKEYIHKDGHRVPIYLTTEPIFDEQGNLDRYISYVQDLTAVLENERLIQAILDTVPVGVAIGDEDGRLYLVNRAYSQMTGRSIEELMEKGWIPITAQEDVEKTRKAIELVSSGVSKEEIIEKSYTKEGGTKRFVKAVYRPIDYKGKRVALYAGMDVTELKEAQEKLKELVEAQQQTIKELSTPLIPVWSKVLMAPLLGSFDSMRMHDLSERLLEYVASQKSKAVLLDLTGLAHVDTQVISEIVRLITSLKLLGSRAILVGIKPHVAQSLVRLGASLEGIPAYATLEQGLRGLIGDASHAKR
jgi:rsbT co-antagonist protein RsbR